MPANALASAPGPRRRSTRAQAEADAAARHRLDLIGASVPDVICSAGAWLADRALAGWDVNVFVPETDDVAPLRILGVTPRPLAEVHRDPRPPTAVAVSADARHLLAEFAGEVAELTVWGAEVPPGAGAVFQSVEHVPSTAARAFKAYALRAAAVEDGAAGDSEVFQAGGPQGAGARRRLRSVGEQRGLPPAAVWAPVPGMGAPR